MNNRPGPGCLTGLIKLFLLDKVYDWFQAKFGYGRGGCVGCGCGTILFILFIITLCGILTNTNWFEFGF